MHGIPAASTTVSWMTRELRMSLESPKQLVPPFCPMRTRRASLSASMLTLVINDRCTQYAVARNGSNFVRCSGMGVSGHLSLLTGLRGMQSSNQPVGQLYLTIA
jgi:hypothetical protein